jgi:UDP-N-acetylmuramate dehydrogenase
LRLRYRRLNYFPTPALFKCIFWVKEEDSLDSEDAKDIIDEEIFKGKIMFNEPMSHHTSLKIGGPVEIMVFPEDPVSLKNVLTAADREDIPVFFFGRGTNLLVEDGNIPGIAVSLKMFGSIELTRQGDIQNPVLYAGAGVPLAALMSFAQKNSFSGLEALAGIPGHVGGAVFMNAGSFGMEIKDVIVSVPVMNMKGEIEVLEGKDLGFSYRCSNIPEGSIILGANFTLEKRDPDYIDKSTKEYLGKKKSRQPLGEFSAGCVFKNPEGDSAGRLIDAAGCKGMRAGDIEVSRVHANFFINRGKGTCSNFLQLMETVRSRVRDYCSAELEHEISIIKGHA